MSSIFWPIRIVEHYSRKNQLVSSISSNWVSTICYVTPTKICFGRVPPISENPFRMKLVLEEDDKEARGKIMMATILDKMDEKSVAGGCKAYLEKMNKITTEDYDYHSEIP